MKKKPLAIQIDFRSSLPAYIQIVNQVEDQVAHGLLQQGDQLPTVRQLAERLGVNFNTVARAYRALDQAGLISTQRGRGTYIWRQPSPETVQALRSERLEALTDEYLEEAEALGFAPEEVAAEFQRRVQKRRQAAPANERQAETGT